MLIAQCRCILMQYGNTETSTYIYIQFKNLVSILTSSSLPKTATQENLYLDLNMHTECEKQSIGYQSCVHDQYYTAISGVIAVLHIVPLINRSVCQTLSIVHILHHVIPPYSLVYTVKIILKVDLTLKRLSQLQSGFIQIQGVVHLLLQGFSVHPLPSESFQQTMNWVAK